eukprot:GSMAST32.ASY1.ANO1.2670.1 assembled CDS
MIGTETKSSASSGCPVGHGEISTGRRSDGDCDAARLTDKSLPVNRELPPNQRPSIGQRIPLSTNRLNSRIPKSEDSGNTWVYPSEQQFYNAMKRKGYTPDERDMNTIIAVHNTVNERTWQQILRWESMHYLSLKARWRNFIGYKLPFDRHDWVIDRCGTPVRYIIDYYNGKADSGSLSTAENFTAKTSMFIDSRPALDSIGAVWDRFRKPIYEQFGLINAKPDLATMTGITQRKNSPNGKSNVSSDSAGRCPY